MARGVEALRCSRKSPWLPWRCSWGSRSGRLPYTFLACCLFFILGPPTVPAQSESPSSPLSLMQQMASLQSKERLLVQRLTERSAQVSELQKDLREARKSSGGSAASSAILETQLSEARAEVTSLRKELKETSSSLDRLKQKQEQSQGASAGYRKEMQDQVKDLGAERDVWKGLSIVTAIGFFLALIWVLFF